MPFSTASVIIVLLLLAFALFENPGTSTASQDISFSQLLSEVDQGRVRDVLIKGPEIHGTFTDGRSFQTYAATLDREPQVSESKKENGNGHSQSLSLAGMKKKQWQWHDYVAVAVGLLFVTAMLFSFRINDWVMRTFTWD